MATILAATGCFVGLLGVLELAQRRPPPAFTNSLCLDAKLEFFRSNPPVEPTHLVVGSSIGWRNFAGDVVVEENPNARPLNGAFCGLSVNQSIFAARFFLERYPTISDVLLVVDPFDMSTCRASKTALFDAADVSDYLSGGSDLKYYFKYFDVLSLLSNAMADRDVFTAHGDGPYDPEIDRGLVYAQAPVIQAECLAAVSAFAGDVHKAGKQLIVVTMPLHGGWSARYDQKSEARMRLASALSGALAGKSAVFWDGWSEAEIPAAAFSDAVHLRWSAVPAFTRLLVTETGFGRRAQ